jgi:hypothetical protein
MHARVPPVNEIYMDASITARWMGVCFYLATTSGMLGQVSTSLQTSQQALPASSTLQVSQNQATLQAFQKEQGALAQERQLLVANGATQQQLQAWQKQNAARFAAQQQRAEAMTVASALSLRRENQQPEIPADASPALKAFLTTQAALAKVRAQIHNRLVQQATASGQSPTFAQVAAMEQRESQLFQQQNAALLTLQAQRSQALADESAQTERTVLPTLVIPPNATPQMAAYLTTQNQINREMIQMRNQYANANPAVKEAAMQKWRQQNAGQLVQLQQQAQSLSQASTTTPN